jgi:serine/threonine protein kinase
LRTYLNPHRLALTGVAEVILARRESPEEEPTLVVLKRLLPHVRSSERFVEVYRERVELARSVVHENVVPILDVVVSPDTVKVVHAHQRGVQLHAMIDGRARVPVGVAARIVAEAASAVQAAHDVGLLHLDLRPSNVFVTEDGHTRVADFGVAAAYVDDAFTRPGTRRQRFAYAPPETLEHEQYDERSDVFTLGVLLWELLAGRRLHTGSSPADVMKSVLAMTVPPPSAVDASVPPALDAVVADALQRDPARRTASAGALRDAIEAALRTVCLNVGERQVAAWMEANRDDATEERHRAELEVMTGEARPLIAPPQPVPAPSVSSSWVAPAPPSPPRWRRPLLLGMLVLFSTISLIALVRILGAMG